MTIAATARWASGLGAMVAACGASGEGQMPNDTAERVVEALNRADLDDYLDAMPSPAQLAQHFDCPPERALVAAIERTRENAPGLLDAWRTAGVRMSLSTFDLTHAEHLALAPGDTHRDCLVKAPVQVVTVGVTLEMQREGRTEKVIEAWPFWRFSDDPAWYQARF